MKKQKIKQESNTKQVRMLSLDSVRLGTMYEVLRNINDGYTITDISNDSNITYCHLHRILILLKDKQLININHEGRVNIITKTKEFNKILYGIEKLIV